MTKIKEVSFYEKIIERAIIGDAEQLSSLITQCKKKSMAVMNEALRIASKNGHTECVKILIDVSTPKTSSSYALRLASENGHTECVKLLISVSEPRSNNSEALRWASLNGHAECVKLLISVSEPDDDNSHALVCAAQNGHVECVRLLISVSNPKTKNNYALQRAAENDNKNCVELLLPHCDILKWSEENWEDMESDMQHIIKSYYSKISLTQNVLPSNDQILKPKNTHKI